MPFRVTARIIRQLGDELISSDAIAFYELIKNAFDARSKRIDIAIVVRIEKARSLLQAIDEMEQPYQVFLHVVDEQGQIVAQHDRVPGQRGKQPTTAWLRGEIRKAASV